MSEFIGFCKQNNAKVCVTKTSKDEAFNKLHAVVNRYFDRAKVFSPVVRQNVYIHSLNRLKKLMAYTGSREIPSDITPVKEMYVRFTKDPEKRKKLEANGVRKKRSTLLPSFDDMKILSEASILAKNSDVYLVTGDNDFLSFTGEIKSELGVNIVSMMDLRNFISTQTHK